LWDIAARFLQKPWLWPEIWQANPQIANPHLIYPGDVLSLAYLDRVTVAARPGPRQEAPIDAIPLAQVEPFLKQLSVVDSIEQLPYVVGLEDNACAPPAATPSTCAWPMPRWASAGPWSARPCATPSPSRPRT
jgi:hypothetical protein